MLSRKSCDHIRCSGLVEIARLSSVAIFVGAYFRMVPIFKGCH